MALYQVGMHWRAGGHDAVSFLHYRDEEGLIPDLLTNFADRQNELADLVKTNVVLGGVPGQTRLADITHSSIVLTHVSSQAYGYDNATAEGVWRPMTSAPSVAQVNLPGLVGGAGPVSLSYSARLRISCAVQTGIPGLPVYRPKGGYIVLPPLTSTQIGTNPDTVSAAYLTSITNFGAAIRATQDSGFFSEGFHAIRYGRGRTVALVVPPGMEYRYGFADISDVTAIATPTWRMSRRTNRYVDYGP